mgnify:CR=1 FL=1
MVQSESRTVTVVGGGASAHVLVPFLSGAGHTVQLLTRQPDRWSSDIRLELQSIDQEVLQTFAGTLSRVSDDPAEIIPQSDIVVLCMPVCAYRAALHQIAPHLRSDPEVAVGTIYGQAGFNWMVDEIVEAFDLESIVSFAVGLIPWICRVRDGIRARFPDREFSYMLDYLALERLSYRSANTDIRESFVSSQTLGAIKPPGVQDDEGRWVIDTDHRFFTDDISYGVCIAKWLAQELGLSVPTIDAIIEWAQELRGESYIEDGRLLEDSPSLTGLHSGIPPVYGMHSLDDLLE